ncbi:MAG: nucleoside deaminase [Deltaproteobacteria bacterium]|nr:nucleoside deaminase [Deltaproteobacteria bacterium]
MSTDEQFMKEAIAEAAKAAAIDEVPIGAVAVAQQQIVARAHNLRESTGDPLGHAELMLLRKLTKRGSRNWRLTEITVYVTCEPCLMCAGALLQARVPRLVYGCKDPKAGACGSLYDVTNDPRLNHRIAVTAGVLTDKCGDLLSVFFQQLRTGRGGVRHRARPSREQKA